MRWVIFPALVAMSGVAVAAQSSPPLRDPVTLNIGFVCQWQPRCMAQQQKAMKRALKFVRKEQPPAWRIQQCNKNAVRNRFRIDWVGFDNCMRNAALRPIPARIIVTRKRSRRLTESSPPSRQSSPPSAQGERGR
jgi:hypothetical protein